MKDLTVSIDGASQETYQIYRVRGKFDEVIGHIRKINEYKKKYNSEFSPPGVAVHCVWSQ